MSGSQGSPYSAQVNVRGSSLGTSLRQLLLADDIEPGSAASYQLCKTIYLYHPLGAKIVEAPIQLAQSQRREVVVNDGPAEQTAEAYWRTWDRLGMDQLIFALCRSARTYGISTLVFGARDVPTNEPIDFWALPKQGLYFNVLDPLNTAGALVLNQDPNSPDFQKVLGIHVAGQAYNADRVCVLFNESPIYIAYTNSGFGYVGRSAYQRALFPLKSFVQSMYTDDMVLRKAGVLVAKLKRAGSVISGLMEKASGLKRALLREAETDNVISIDTEENIESLNLQNVDGAASAARKNVLENVATAVPMPAILLNSQTFATGFGEGTEDANNVARYIASYRQDLQQVYTFCDRIVQHVAWDEDFYAVVQNQFPEQYQNVPYRQAFMRWRNSFEAKWPSLLIEPDSEKVQVEKTKMEAITSMLETLLPNMDPENKAALLQWAVDNFNESKMLFTTALELDLDLLKDWLVEAQQKLEQTEDLGASGGAAPKGDGAEEDVGPGGKAPGQAEPSAPKPKKLQVV